MLFTVLQQMIKPIQVNVLSVQNPLNCFPSAKYLVCYCFAMGNLWNYPKFY